MRLRTPSHQPVRVDQLADRLPQKAWSAYLIKEGSKGPIICDFAFLRVTAVRDELPGPSVWLVLRRNPGSSPGQALGNPNEIKFYLSNAPADIDKAELVRISGMRWPIETAFEQGKEEVGLDHYETRSWLGWHHHMTWSFLAHHFLVRLRIQLKEPAPDQIRGPTGRLCLRPHRHLSVGPGPRRDPHHRL